MEINEIAKEMNLLVSDIIGLTEQLKAFENKVLEISRRVAKHCVDLHEIAKSE